MGETIKKWSEQLEARTGCAPKPRRKGESILYCAPDEPSFEAVVLSGLLSELSTQEYPDVTLLPSKGMRSQDSMLAFKGSSRGAATVNRGSKSEALIPGSHFSTTNPQRSRALGTDRAVSDR
jgi:hypothetical protein